MAIDSTITASPRIFAALGSASRQNLKFSPPMFASHRDFQIYTLNRNALAKAAQLVGDLEDARAARATLENFLNGKNGRTAPLRGSLFDAGI